MTEKEAIEALLYQEDMRGEGFDYQVNNLVIAKAVKALEEIQQYRAIGTVEECREAMERQEKYYNSEWISCEDRLPEVGQIVIVYQSFRGIHGNSETHISIGQYLGNGNDLPHWRFISYMVNIYGELTYASIADNWQGDSEYVISWRTLPEPYRNTLGEGDAYE